MKWLRVRRYRVHQRHLATSTITFQSVLFWLMSLGACFNLGVGVILRTSLWEQNMSSWKSAIFCALVKQEINTVEAIFNKGSIPWENITIQYAKDCNTCVGNLEYPMNPVQQNVDFVLRELKVMIDAGHCRCFSYQNETENLGVMQSVSLLHLACVYGPVSLVERLLNAGYDPKECSLAVGFTPLHYLSQSDSIASDDVIEIAEMLLTRGIDVNVMDKNRNVPLHLAIENKHTRLALLLIDHHSLLNVENDAGETPLLLAAKQHEEEVLVRLCEASIRHNVKDPSYILALNIAIQQQNLVMIKAILSNPHVNPNETCYRRLGYRCMPPLLLAASNGYTEAVRLLLQCGAFPDCVDDDGHQPLLVAAYANKLDIARLLICHGADVNRTRRDGYSALHHAAWEGHTEMCRLLLEAGAEYDTRTSDRNTPLALACHGDHLQTVALLLGRRCNVNNQDKDLDTPIHYSTYNGNTDAVRLLLRHGANPDVENTCHVTPIWNAVYANVPELVQLLIQCNVRLDVASRGINQHSETDYTSAIYDTPRSPFYVACSKNVSLAHTLVLAGARLTNESWFWCSDVPKRLSNHSVELNSPQSLLRQTRIVIRRLLGIHPHDKVQTLPITAVMKDFLIIKSFAVDL